jgi:hypothetical protein
MSRIATFSRLSAPLADTGFLLKLLRGHLGRVLLALARAFVVRIGLLGRAGIVALRHSIVDRPPGGVLVAVAGVIDQLLLGLFEPFGLALACLRQRPLCLVGLNPRRLIRARLPAYASGFGRRQIGLF